MNDPLPLPSLELTKGRKEERFQKCFDEHILSVKVDIVSDRIAAFDAVLFCIVEIGSRCQRPGLLQYCML
jgi:hypothetical protein